MAYISKRSSGYKPWPRQIEIVKRAAEHMRAVPYRVSLRWLFYAVLQDGFYSDKDDYLKFKGLMANVRHNGYDGWRPDSIMDDTRAGDMQPGEGETAADWVNITSEYQYGCTLDHFYSQEVYTAIWFEARAMYSQFKYYTSGVSLFPFGGSPSIDFKYRISKGLEQAAERYGKPIKVLYFGDYDAKGFEIQTTAERDIRNWCAVDFELIRCGLNKGDPERYGLPENPKKPGQYQWEAVRDADAKEIITSSVGKYVDADIFKEVEAEGVKPGELLTEYMSGFERYYRERILTLD